MPMKEYYRILGLSESADMAELNERYRNKIKLFHPDLFAGDPEKQKKANEKTKEINHAYSELKKIIAKRPPSKTKQDDTEGADARHRDALNNFDFFGSVYNFISKLTKKNVSGSAPDSSENNSKIAKQPRSQFREVLKNKMETTQQRKPSATSYSKTYRELQKKRALYGNRQKDGSNEKGPISPVSAVQGIKNNRVQ
ncbi:J domain-containing protein [Desulforegula conservatrix]|uniref:J domain-containing protein n=1 Tax=Desulforegula conservatrix TaxID=153026 RepID=UPI000425CDA8|nr:J domain-containing protein [Desulforegula conservatrix]